MSEKNITIVEIISMLDDTQTAILDPREEITGFNSIHKSKKHDMTFCSYRGDAGAELIRASSASLIICHQSLYGALPRTKANIAFVKNPRLAFIKCIQKFFPNDEIPAEIHTTAVVESKHVGKDVHIGPHSYIGKNAVIGENSIIHNNVVIYDNVHIGENVVINSNTVIGKDGFGFERNDRGILVRFPHAGGVRIHDHVEIGANVTIDRGTIHDTVIERGSKIDNLVHVAHNAKIGKNCSIVANSCIAGSCIIGENVSIAMTVTLREGIKIGSNSLVGMGSVVTRDVPEHVIVYGNPAKIIRDYP
ncbi:MAG: UDP-3-O-(3-hydroxymyristoyl)glucosamine N-acyltransferase [Thaumarchaeota archaeon]|nr:UDP-3-O-(3-hydroxymyristoyl)glucosamine N-acyltransferase [Nitrososphaerota archaeon]